MPKEESLITRLHLLNTPFQHMAAFLGSLCLFSVAAPCLAQTAITAAEKFQNVKVLGTMPAEQMGKVMNLMSASLGVNCDHCHEGSNFAKEDVGQKESGRRMLAMTLAINRENFDGLPKVTCHTCHQGQAFPSNKISLDAFTKQLASKPVSKPLPQANEIVSRYVLALGGSEKLKAIQTRHVVAKRVEPSGGSEHEELWLTAQGQSRMLTQYGKTAVVEGFDGQQAWKKVNDRHIDLKPDEAEQIQREASLAFGHTLETAYANLQTEGQESIGDRLVYALRGESKSGMTERLFFDVENGLLIRRVASVPTVLGDFDYQVDYEMYREQEGIRYPAKVRFSVPNIQWTREVLEVNFNEELQPSLTR